MKRRERETQQDKRNKWKEGDNVKGKREGRSEQQKPSWFKAGLGDDDN